MWKKRAQKFVTLPYTLERLRVLATIVEIVESTKYLSWRNLSWRTILDMQNAYADNFLYPIFIGLLASYCVYYAFLVYNNLCIKKEIENVEVSNNDSAGHILSYAWVPLIVSIQSLWGMGTTLCFSMHYYRASELKYICGLTKNYEVSMPVFDAISGVLQCLTMDLFIASMPR